MEIETLRWLVAVADGATVSEAAHAAHTTQPAVTRGLQRIAREFGTPMIERNGRRVRLTPAGRTVAAAARTIVRSYDEARRAVVEANDPFRGTVRLGFLSPLGTWLVPQLLVRFHATHPDVRFELRQDGVTRIMQALIDGELDLLISAEPNDPRLRWEQLFDEELKLAVPASHPLARRRRIRPEQLAGEPWVLLPTGYGLRAHAERICQAAGFAPMAAFEGPDLATLHALIGAGRGVGLFPARPLPPDGVRQVSLSPRVMRSVGLVDVPERVQPGAARAFAATVRAQASGYASGESGASAPD